MLSKKYSQYERSFVIINYERRSGSAKQNKIFLTQQNLKSCLALRHLYEY